MLPIELLREIASHWPARNGLPRTCRQLAHGHPGPSAYARTVTTSVGCNTLMRTMLPNNTLHGECRLFSSRRAVGAVTDAMTLQYELGQLISGAHTDRGDVIGAFETTHFVGRPYLSTCPGNELMVFMRSSPAVSALPASCPAISAQPASYPAIRALPSRRDAVMWVEFANHIASVGVAPTGGVSTIISTKVAFTGSTMDDLRAWYQENEQTVLNVPGVSDIARDSSGCVNAPGSVGWALKAFTELFGDNPLPGVRAK